MSRIYGIILAAVLLWPTGAASDPSNQAPWIICGLTVKLGMPEDAVRSRWSKDCHVTEPSPGWLSFARKRAGLYDLLGSVTIAGGRVVAADREWLPAGARTGQEFGEAIYGALLYAGMIGSTAQIAAREQRSPEFSSQWVEITSPGRRVAFYFGSHVAAGVNEMIGSPQASGTNLPQSNPLNRLVAALPAN
jgi:hypothetical protein